MNDDVKIINTHTNEDPEAKDNDGSGDLGATETDLEADDNVLDAAHSVGLYEEADEEHPAELGLANQVEEAEKVHQEEN